MIMIKKALVQKWGKTLALRIPAPVAQEVPMHAGDKMDVRVAKGRMVVTPPRGARYRLKDLLAGIRKTNLHREIPTGERQGRAVC